MQESTKKEIFSWVRVFLFIVVAVILIRTFLFTTIMVNGDSMFPTFADKDRVIVNKVSEIQRFDMVVFDAPDSDSLYIKRVIGLPGDSIEIKDDILFVNGNATEEPYLEENKQNNEFDYLTDNFSLEELTGEPKVPEGMLFVMGDNRIYSKDSRNFGFIPKESLIGEAILQYLPLKKIGIPK